MIISTKFIRRSQRPYWRVSKIRDRSSPTRLESNHDIIICSAWVRSSFNQKCVVDFVLARGYGTLGGFALIFYGQFDDRLGREWYYFYFLSVRTYSWYVPQMCLNDLNSQLLIVNMN